MHDDHNDDLTTDEERMLSALPRQAPPPPELEERLVTELRVRGMIHPSRSWARPAAIAAMLLLSVSLGYIMGARAGAGPTTIEALIEERPTFALLVFDPVTPNPDAQTQVAVAEAQAWAGELAEIGVFRAAEKLTDGGRRLEVRDGNVERVAIVPHPDDNLVLGGFFMIHVDSFDEAQRIAADCPLLQYGSTIEIRAIDDI